MAFGNTQKDHNQLSFEDVILKTNPYIKKGIKNKKILLDKELISNGYIKFVGLNGGEFEGRNDYYLFKGNPSNLVIHDSQDQDLELKQNFDLFIITGNQIRKVTLKEIFPEKKISELFKKRPLPFAHNWTTCCKNFYELPKKEKEIKLVISNDDPNFYDIRTAEKAVVGTLSWNGNKFTLKEIEKPLVIKMSN